MAKRDNHYEAAFEAYLQARQIAYVAVDEARRSRIAAGSLKNVDFLVSPADGLTLLVDVKGRRFPSGVSLYWVVNSIVGVAFNILTYGFPALKIEPLLKVRNLPSQSPADPAASPAAAVTSSRELRTANGPGRSKRQNRRRRP